MSNELLNDEVKLEKTGNHHLLTSRNVPMPLLLCLWDVVILDTEGPQEANAFIIITLWAKIKVQHYFIKHRQMYLCRDVGINFYISGSKYQELISFV